MSVEQKSRFKKVTKILAGTLFIALLFFNFKIAVNDEKTDGINLFGLKISAFVSDTYATAPVSICWNNLGCNGGYNWCDWWAYGDERGWVIVHCYYTVVMSSH